MAEVKMAEFKNGGTRDGGLWFGYPNVISWLFRVYRGGGGIGLTAIANTVHGGLQHLQQAMGWVTSSVDDI
jgi:hypothetical protein